MIEDARSFLYVSTFYVEHDAYGAAALDALAAAAKRGVAVHLFVDAFGQRLGGAQMSHAQRAGLARRLSALGAAGGRVEWYHPPHLVQRWLGGGMHVKVQVSEAGEAIFGSSNLTRVSFEAWNEYAVAVRGPIVRLLLERLRALGARVAETHLAALAAIEDAAPADLPLAHWACDPCALQGALGPIGWRGPNAITDHLVAMLDAAREEIAITSFYFKPTGALRDAVLRAAKRGVRVEVHHSHRAALPSTDLAWIAAAVSYGPLLEAGVTLYENLRGEHSKIVLVDRAWVAFGSYNFEDAAHDRLAEAMLASRDARAVAPAAAIFEALRRAPTNVRVTRDSLRHLSARIQSRVLRYGRFKWWL
jgi:cardiolipin synthase